MHFQHTEKKFCEFEFCIVVSAWLTVHDVCKSYSHQAKPFLLRTNFSTAYTEFLHECCNQIKPSRLVHTFVLMTVHEPIMFHFTIFVALESLSNYLFCTICFSKCMCPAADMNVCCGWEGSVLAVDGKETAISKHTKIATQ